MRRENQAGKWVTRYSARGYPFAEWEPAMPRIQDIYLDSVVYLYRSQHEAMEGINIGGSGFLLTVPCEQLPYPAAFLYAVTNKHVIAEAKCTCVRLNTADGAMDVLPFKEATWLCSETDDLAVCVMPRLNEGGFQMRALPMAWLLTEQRVADHDIGIGDEVIVIGRFINREGVQRNSPTARFGFIAQMPGDPVDYEIAGKLHSQESFLVEAKSIGGYSGSPVFLTPDPTVNRPKPLPEDRTFILGVDCAHVHSWDNVFDADHQRLPHLQVRQNTGMMPVIPAWKLTALLNSEPAKELRAMFEDREIKRRKAPKATPDSSAPAGISDSDDANPNHLKDFTRLVDVAARKRPQGGQT